MLHVQIRNEAQLLQQQLISLEANLGQSGSLDKVLGALSGLDFIDAGQTDSCLQEMQQGLKELRTEVKRSNPSLLIINSLNDLTRSFQRLRSLYLTHRLQLFRERPAGGSSKPLGESQVPYNPALKAEQNFHLNLRRLDARVSSELQRLHKQAESVLTQVFQQLQKANPQEIEVAAFCDEELQTLQKLQEIVAQIAGRQGGAGVSFSGKLDGLASQLAQVQQEFTETFKASLAQAAQIQNTPVNQPTPPPSSQLQGIADDAEHITRAVELTAAQIQHNIEGYQPTALKLLVGVREPSLDQIDQARHLGQKLTAECEEKLERITKLEAAVQKAHKEIEINRLALERGNRQLLAVGLEPLPLDKL